MKFTVFIAFFCFGLMSAADQRPAKIIGDNDLVAVNADASNIPLMYRSMVDAFGHMSMGCTATHIGNGYVLTAGHCFWADEVPLVDQSCNDLTVDWGVREGATSYLTSKCERLIVAQRSGMMDYAIFKVSPIPPVAIAPDLQRRAIIGDTLTIFSHPEELPLRWSGSCGVERLQHPGLPDGSIQHKCDTNPGSSGATIIDVMSLKIVGIHDGGYEGDLELDPEHPESPVSTGMNYGTFILNSPLEEALKSLGFN